MSLTIELIIPKNDSESKTAREPDAGCAHIDTALARTYVNRKLRRSLKRMSSQSTEGVGLSCVTTVEYVRINLSVGTSHLAQVLARAITLSRRAYVQWSPKVDLLFGSPQGSEFGWHVFLHLEKDTVHDFSLIQCIWYYKYPETPM